MIKPSGETIGKIVRWRWTLAILGAVSATAMLWNSLFVRSPILGLSVSLLIFYVSSRAAANLFFFQEKPFVREILGFAVFVSMASLLGIALILATIYTEIMSLIGITALVLVLCVTSAFKEGSSNRIVPKQLKTGNAKDSTFLVLLCAYIVSTAAAFYSLLLARTGEGEISVWLRIPSYFLLWFFLSSLFLVLMLFFTRMPNSLKLLPISVHSFLSHSLFLIVWYPGRYGDPWGYLGEMRFIDKAGTIFAYSHLLRNFLVGDIIKYQGQYSLTLLFKRMFSLDIYWVHIVLILMLWSLLVPIFLYKVAESITDKGNPKFLLLTAMGASLFSTLIYWGAIAQANSLGFIFLLFSVVLLLKWFDGGERKFWIMSLVASILTIMTHPQPGIFAFIFLFGATALRMNLPAILKALSYILLFTAYPVLLYFHSATFFPSGLVNLENFLSFLSQTATLLFVLVFVGLLFSVKSRHVKRKSVALLFLFYVTILTGYYVTAYGLKNLPYSPERIIAMADILSTPLVALGLLMTASFLKKGFSMVKGSRLKNASPSAVGILMICLFLSTQATLALYNAYPRNDSDIQPAWYEIEAAYYINSTSEKYVVLDEPGFANLAVGFLGSDYSYGNDRGVFGVPLWDWWVNQLWWRMVNNPSIDILKEAMDKTGATVGYVVVSVRMHGGLRFEDVVERVSGVLPVDRVFGNGKLYVFKHAAQVAKGKGPYVKVIYDEGASEENVTTEFSYTFVNEVNYNLTLSGHSSYNITEYPTYWTFLALYVNQELSGFDNSSDINKFVYVSGLAPKDVIEAVWQANNLYQKAGWKEDSFKYGWQTDPYSSGTVIPTIVRDGNVLAISWNFISEKLYYYHYAKRVDISTDDYPYILVRWKSTGFVAEVLVGYVGDERNRDSIVPFCSKSESWTVTIAKLPPGKKIAYVTVGITNYKDAAAVSGLQTLYVDYVLIGARQ